MTNKELIEQFERCMVWQDADQWDLLGLAYFNRGFVLNAAVCFTNADACRVAPAEVASVFEGESDD